MAKSVKKTVSFSEDIKFYDPVPVSLDEKPIKKSIILLGFAPEELGEKKESHDVTKQSVLPKPHGVNDSPKIITTTTIHPGINSVQPID